MKSAETSLAIKKLTNVRDQKVKDFIRLVSESLPSEYEYSSFIKELEFRLFVIKRLNAELISLDFTLKEQTEEEIQELLNSLTNKEK